METNKIPIYCSRLLNLSATDSQAQKMWHKLGCDINYWPAHQAADIASDSFEPTYSSNITSMYKHILDNHTEAIIMEYNTVPVIANIQELYSAIKNVKQEFPKADIIILASQQSTNSTHKEPPISRKIIGKNIPNRLQPPIRQIPVILLPGSESRTCFAYNILKQPFTIPYLFYITASGVKALLEPPALVINTPIKHAEQIVEKAAKLNLVITSRPFCRPPVETINKVEK